MSISKVSGVNGLCVNPTGQINIRRLLKISVIELCYCFIITTSFKIFIVMFCNILEYHLVGSKVRELNGYFPNYAVPN